MEISSGGNDKFSIFIVSDSFVLDFFSYNQLGFIQAQLAAVTKSNQSIRFMASFDKLEQHFESKWIISMSMSLREG